MAFVNLPPNLQDLFYSITDRVAKLETGPNSAQTTADAAQTTANSAQTDATTAISNANAALAAANIAYTLAGTSLQKDANTITNASNNMTAINANGITVYSGASMSSGARVIMNSAGIAGYDSGGSPTFSILASTGAASFKGAITGSAITGSSLNIGGNFYVDGSTGLLTCTGATVTGTITATSGSFTGSVYASSGTIGGWTLTSGQIYSGSSSMNASTGNAAFNDITAFGTLYATSYTQLMSTLYVASTLTVDNSVTFGTSNQFKYLASSGTLRSSYTYGNAVSGRAMQINSNGDFGTTASTLRKKHEIEPYEIDQEALLQLEPKKFKYLPEIDPEQHQEYGFIAEQAEELGLDELVLYDSEGRVDYFAYEKLPIFLLQVIKDQDKRIKLLEGK